MKTWTFESAGLPYPGAAPAAGKSRSAPLLDRGTGKRADDAPCLRWTDRHAASTAIIKH